MNEPSTNDHERRLVRLEKHGTYMPNTSVATARGDVLLVSCEDGVNACALADFEVVLERILLSPLNSEEILLNPDAPSFVWYEVHSLRVDETPVTSEAQKETVPKAPKDSEEMLQEFEKVAT